MISLDKKQRAAQLEDALYTTVFINGFLLVLDDAAWKQLILIHLLVAESL